MFRGISQIGRAASRRLRGRNFATEAKAPYQPHRPASIYGDTARPFNIGPDYKMEGWEVPVLLTFLTCGGMLFYSEVLSDRETAMVCDVM